MLAALTSLPIYPRSLLDPRWQVLTMDAPTLPLVAQGLYFVGLALLLRPLVETVLADSHRWAVVTRANQLAMPVYLWHMTAYLLAVTLLAAVGAKFATATALSASWWWGRPVVMAVSAGFLIGTIAVTTMMRRLVHTTGTPLSVRGR
jgi:hypothetical protein